MIRILFLAANPLDQAHLRIRQEFDELRHGWDTAEHPSFAINASNPLSDATQ